MPIIQSAKKRVRQAKKATIRNVKTKRSYRSAVKEFESLASSSPKKAADALNQAQSEIDKAVKKGVLHKNTAARKKQQLAKQAKDAGVTASPTKKSTTKKPAAKKTTTKKTSAKKPAAKKSPAKKSVTSNKSTKKASAKAK